MRRFARHVLASIAGLALGLASAWWAIASMPAGESYGVWHSDPLTGSAAAGAYTRARIARHGLLALNRDEARYLIATQDDDGRPLSARCDYRIHGAALAAQWWSLTLYARDEFLPRNGEHAYSLDAAHVQTDADGAWTARLAATRADAANWLASAGTGAPSLALRLYRPRGSLGAMTMPAITRERCQ